jgi:hypothetical protein
VYRSGLVAVMAGEPLDVGHLVAGVPVAGRYPAACSLVPVAMNGL